MTEQAANRGRRVRRSTQVIRKLERARERNNRQLAEARIREQRVDQALRDYFAATEQIGTVEETYRQKISQLEARIGELRAESAAKEADVRASQAWALFVIHGSGRTVKQVADLVELSEKATRHLIGLGRDTPPKRLGRRAGDPADDGHRKAADWQRPAPIDAVPAATEELAAPSTSPTTDRNETD